MLCGFDDLNAQWLWWLYCSIILTHASGFAMLGTSRRDRRPDGDHNHHKMMTLVLMIGVTQAKFRDGNAPMITPLFNFDYFDH